MSQQCFGKSITVSETHKARKVVYCHLFGWQSLRLFIVDHLQPVFDRSKKAIGCFHRVTRGFINPLVVAKLIQGREGIAVAQRRIPATCDELLGLNKKLDFTDPAAPQLDIVTFDSDLTRSEERRAGQ